ncbi:MAG: hypothetical protein HOO98_05790 [Nitrospira sp.]|nr:hypothetical protein [Nitrospira sp.]
MKLRSQSTTNFLSDRDGFIHADERLITGGTWFRLELAEVAGVEFPLLPTGKVLPQRPMATAENPALGERQLLTLYCHSEVVWPITVSHEQVTEAIFGPPPSLASWLQHMSGGAYRVSNAGVHGSIRIPVGPTIDGMISSDPGMGAVLTSAESAGVPLRSFSPGGAFDLNRVMLLEVSTYYDGGQFKVGGQVRPRDGTSRSGIRLEGRVPWVGFLPDSIDEGSRMVACHEVSHALFDVTDRYFSRQPIVGDVTAPLRDPRVAFIFILERVGGPGPIRSGDRVMLRVPRASNNQWVAPSQDRLNLVNVEGETAGDDRIFTIRTPLAADRVIWGGSEVVLVSNRGYHLTAELGGNSAVTANRSNIEEGMLLSLDKSEGPAGPLQSGDRIVIRTRKGFYFNVGERDDLSRFAPEDIASGAWWTGSVGDGQGGGFDNADVNYTAVMLSLYDRIRLGWVRPRYLTPENRGAYLVRPFLESRDALILFDPENPLEWYTLENRQRRGDVDEVPSSGIVISWMCRDDDYWREWLTESRMDVRHGLYPAVISAAAPTVPPNIMARPLTLDINTQAKRRDPNAAFTNQELVLPLGNGDPSRFHLSFHADGANITVCVR